jgi:hypothetical protein
MTLSGSIPTVQGQQIRHQNGRRINAALRRFPPFAVLVMTDPKIEQRRQEYLEWLYQQSGRTCSTYTGLYQERLKELVESDMKEAGL